MKKLLLSISILFVFSLTAFSDELQFTTITNIGNWDVRQKIDPITDIPSYIFMLQSDETLDNNWDYSGLVIRIGMYYEDSIEVFIQWGQGVKDLENETEIITRFDKKPPEEITTSSSNGFASFLTNWASVVIELYYSELFVARIPHHKGKVETRIFRVNGFKEICELYMSKYMLETIKEYEEYYTDETEAE